MTRNRRYFIGVSILFLTCGLIIVYLINQNKNTEEKEIVQENTPVVTATPTVVPTPTPKVMLADLVPYYEKNSDLIGWIKIGDTKINNPVMFTPGDNEFYLDKDFDKKASIKGSLYIDAESEISTPNTNIIIYGHNMKDGSMFGTLDYYKDESYYKKYPTITFNTLYEEGEYEIFGAFYAKVLNKSDTTSYRYYNFRKANTEEEFNEFVNYVKGIRQYNTGIEPVYGDQLITLSTCSYHVKDGRFAIAARRKNTP